MIIPVTIGSYLAYFRSGYNFAEHLVLNAYLTGQLVIADIILMALRSTSLDENHKIAFHLIEFFLKYPYWILTYWGFFKPSKWYWGVIQFILSQIFASIALYLLLFGASFVLLKLKGSH